MVDICNDNRLVSLTSRPGIRNLLTTLLDQLQRCQKSLNEFLEVSAYNFQVKERNVNSSLPEGIFMTLSNIYECYKIFAKSSIVNVSQGPKYTYCLCTFATLK